MLNTLSITFNASGTFNAAKRGDVVMIVDVIDMSTTAEALILSGAKAVMGASPDKYHEEFKVNPERIGYIMGKYSKNMRLPLILVGEPRLASEKEIIKGCKKVISGVHAAGMALDCVLPNIGGEITNHIPPGINRKGFNAIIATASGGVCFDIAYNNGAKRVLTGTTARVKHWSGLDLANKACERSISHAKKTNSNITIVGASSNCLADIQAAYNISSFIVQKGFLRK